MTQPPTDDRLLSRADPHRPPLEEHAQDHRSATRRVRRVLLGVSVSLLTLAYHSHHAVGQIIQGSDSDGHIVVAWEYDLDQDTGQLLIHNIDVPTDDDELPLFLAGLIPPTAVNISYDPNVISVDPPCLPGWMPPFTLLTDLAPGAETNIAFDFGDQSPSACPLPPCPTLQAVPGQVDYGHAFLISAAACSPWPLGILPNFVSVAPIEITCDESDRDGDGDVDMRDFAGFQGGFAEPDQLICYRKMFDDLTGPQ